MGQGKSTLAKILAGELKADSGRITAPKMKVVYHSQKVSLNLFDELKISEQLEMLMKFTGQPVRFFCLKSQIDNTLDLYPDQLSGGQSQLIGFVMSMMKQGELYIFDELLNHLDKRMGSKILNWIANHVAKKNISFAIISHDIFSAAKYGTSYLWFEKGQISDPPTGHDKLDNDKLAEYFLKKMRGAQ